MTVFHVGGGVDIDRATTPAHRIRRHLGLQLRPVRDAGERGEEESRGGARVEASESVVHADVAAAGRPAVGHDQQEVQGGARRPPRGPAGTRAAAPIL